MSKLTYEAKRLAYHAVGCAATLLLLNAGGFHKIATCVYLLAMCCWPGYIVPCFFQLTTAEMGIWRRLNRLAFFPVIFLWAAAFLHSALHDTRHGRTAMNVSPFWGPVTAGIDWCEANYVGSPFVAELWNTVTTSWIVLQGVTGVATCIYCGHPKRFGVAYCILILIGAGSAVFHGMMTRVSQLGDELPMVWLLASLMYICYRDFYEPGLWVEYVGVPYSIFASVCTLWSSNPLFFQIPFFVCVIFMAALLIRRVPDDPVEDALRQFGWTWLQLASVAWTIERLSCPYFSQVESLHLHSWWHVFIGLGVAMHIQAMLQSSQRRHNSALKVKFALCGTMPCVMS